MPMPNAFIMTLRLSVVIYGPSRHRVAKQWCPYLRSLSKHLWYPRGHQPPETQALGYRQRVQRRGGRYAVPFPWPNIGLEPTPYSLRSVRRESDMSECGNTIGYTGTRWAFGAKRYRPLSRVSSMHLKDAMT